MTHRAPLVKIAYDAASLMQVAHGEMARAILTSALGPPPTERASVHEGKAQGPSTPPGLAAASSQLVRPCAVRQNDATHYTACSSFLARSAAWSAVMSSSRPLPPAPINTPL
jgi:hypothetical protein